jgi:hypothetical protein
VTTHLHMPTLTGRTESSVSSQGTPMLWLGSGALLFFLVPWIGTDRLGLQPDLYYLIYFTVAVAFFAAFVTTHATALRPLWTKHLWQSLLIGTLVGIALAAGIFAQAATPHEGGWRYGFEIAWRGVIYGSVDALTLFVFPAAVAYVVMRGNRQGLKRKTAFAGLALALSLLVTTTYHLGYSEYRGELLRYPEIGALAANIPTALSGNPLGAVATHVTMHVSSVIHQNQGGPAHMIPPRVTADYPNHGSSDIAAALAAGWLLATAGALTVLVRRQRHS